MNAANEAELQGLRGVIRDRLKVATSLGLRAALSALQRAGLQGRRQHRRASSSSPPTTRRRAGARPQVHVRGGEGRPGPGRSAGARPSAAAGCCACTWAATSRPAWSRSARRRAGAAVAPMPRAIRITPAPSRSTRAERLADGGGHRGGAADRGAGPDVGRRDLLRHRPGPGRGSAARGRGAGRPRLLAARPGLLHLLRTHAHEPRRRDPPGQRRQRHRPRRRRRPIVRRVSARAPALR